MIVYSPPKLRLKGTRIIINLYIFLVCFSVTNICIYICGLYMLDPGVRLEKQLHFKFLAQCCSFVYLLLCIARIGAPAIAICRCALGQCCQCSHFPDNSSLFETSSIGNKCLLNMPKLQYDVTNVFVSIPFLQFVLQEASSIGPGIMQLSAACFLLPALYSFWWNVTFSSQRPLQALR